jgi:menaquinone-9 beta-reductase
VEAAELNTTHDAIVIGAGPAGSSAALLLARAGWAVALVERKAFPRPKVCGEYLSATNLPLFDQLGIGELFRAMAGTPVRKVGLFAGTTIAQSELPRPSRRFPEWGRALAREQLDTWLRDQASAAGVEMFQPWTVDELTEEAGVYHCQAQAIDSGASAILRTTIVVAAHGSWERGSLPTQSRRPEMAADDLLGFKAHFVNSDLPDGLMPLLAFPGGYGGMVHTDGGRVSLSCCVRRDQLANVRARYRLDAGEAVLMHIQDSCLGVRRTLRGAGREGSWLAAGPIRPGIRVESRAGLFLVGNAAGEAHPVVAEGISMAMQSSWLLADRLAAWKHRGARRTELAGVQRDYAAAWRRNFAFRIRASAALANWAMRPASVALSLPLLWCFPRLLTWGARCSGKTHALVG